MRITTCFPSDFCYYLTMKKLYRSNENKVFAGIFGGLGEYLDIDPVVLRLIWIFVTVVTGVIPGLIGYFISIFIIPKNKNKNEKK